jgi:NAD(P)-binding Rossmann-like domain
MNPSMLSAMSIRPHHSDLAFSSQQLQSCRACRGSNGRLRIQAVAVREVSSNRRPAVLAGDGQSSHGHSDKKKVLIVGAGWAGVRQPPVCPHAHRHASYVSAAAGGGLHPPPCIAQHGNSTVSFAGFGAAKHLSQQGYAVTLLDASPNPGGLSSGWRTPQGRAVEAGWSICKGGMMWPAFHLYLRVLPAHARRKLQHDSNNGSKCAGVKGFWYQVRSIVARTEELQLLASTACKKLCGVPMTDLPL